MNNENQVSNPWVKIQQYFYFIVLSVGIYLLWTSTLEDKVVEFFHYKEMDFVSFLPTMWVPIVSYGLVIAWILMLVATVLKPKPLKPFREKGLIYYLIWFPILGLMGV